METWSIRRWLQNEVQEPIRAHLGELSSNVARKRSVLIKDKVKVSGDAEQGLKEVQGLLKMRLSAPTPSVFKLFIELCD